MTDMVKQKKKSIREYIGQLQKLVDEIDHHSDECIELISSLMETLRRMLTVGEDEQAEKLYRYTSDYVDKYIQSLEDELGEDVDTTLILELNVGPYPYGKDRIDDYRHLLDDSHFNIKDCKIKDVKQHVV